MERWCCFINDEDGRQAGVACGGHGDVYKSQAPDSAAPDRPPQPRKGLGDGSGSISYFAMPARRRRATALGVGGGGVKYQITRKDF